MFENPRRGRQARNFTTNVPKILDLKSPSEQIFLEHWHWVPLITSTLSLKNVLPFLNRYGIRLNGSGYPFKKNFHPFERFGLSVRRKKLSSVWTACAIRSKKKCHPFERLGLSVWKKLSSPRMAWDIRFKKLLSIRMARAIHSKKKLSTVGGTEPICSKINFSRVSIPKPFHL